MEPAAMAVMVLLSCSPEATDCREMRGAESYASLEACRAALRPVLERFDSADRTVIGRCSLGEDGPAGIDPMITGSTAALEPGLSTVYVTRYVDGHPVTDAYDVPRTR